MTPGLSGGLAGAAMPMVSPGRSRGGKRMDGELMELIPFLLEQLLATSHEQF
jgi:hypothetical protein